jgi:E3 ubiquitin-protein ligase HERC2
MFQLHAMLSHSVDVSCVGLGPNTNLLSSLKQHVVELASNIGVLNTIQSAAQATLQAGWSILLPTADERAKTLSALLPSTGNILFLAEAYSLDRFRIVLSVFFKPFSKLRDK